MIYPKNLIKSDEMKPPKIIIPINIVDTLGCVYKVLYKDKYIVVMGKSMYRSIDSINLDIERYFKGVSEKSGAGNLYKNFYQFVIANPGDMLVIEMIISTDNAYQLLKHCQIELDKGCLDPNCFNTFFTPYINKDIQKPADRRKSAWWVNRGTYLNFLRWRNKHSLQHHEV